MNQKAQNPPYLVSACLMGERCKYSGGHNYSPAVAQFLEDKAYILVCPEVLGGLATPRDPLEISGGTGELVLEGKAQVKSKTGQNETVAFIEGAEKVLEMALKNGCKNAILKENSPSCGSTAIYDGSFSNKKIKGSGVTTALLRKHHITVVNEASVNV